MELYTDIGNLIEAHVYQNAIELLPIKPSALGILQDLPFHHKDPFDRMIISQGMADDLILLSRDENFASYSAKCLW